ncbi:substrate-binding domain-containing protein [Aestuariibius sp. 2305UL40-4]|uniref:substrate-binding domain-containing protein n=1 Tax=Aestuariibius violaceus TaxID=3234132 RepID=UPI00345E4F81
MAAADPESPEFLTVKELAQLLRIKERKVYDLAASGAVPVSRVTGKLLFPEAEIRDWIGRGRSGAVQAAPVRPPVFLGSHDPLLDWALRQSRAGLATFLDGSLDGLTRFGACEGVATGLHLRDAASGLWNVPAVEGLGDAVLLSWARRRRGLLVRTEEIGGLPALAGRRVVPRQAEAGTQALFQQVAGEAGLDLAEVQLLTPARSEDDAARAVAEGVADAAFGLEALAGLYGLRFVPVVEERFDLLVDRRAWFEPPLQRLAAFCRGAEFAERAEAQRGYDFSGLFEVRWNA